VVHVANHKPERKVFQARLVMTENPVNLVNSD
jgi:hypothetical protein